MEMREVDVLNNIKGQEYEKTEYPALDLEAVAKDLKQHDYEPQHYHLSKAEAEQCIKALEKQIPYKVKHIELDIWECKCGAKISGSVSDYCYKCGQKIEYED